MKAYIFKGSYSMELEEIPQPSVKEDEVLIEIYSSGICGSDIHGFSGSTGRRYPGMVMGHEFSGRIADLGVKAAEKNSRLSVGQKAVVQPIIYCGRCEMCLSGRTSLCFNKKMVGVNMDTVGGFSEYVSVPAGNVFPIDDSVPYPTAALTEPFAVGASAASAAAVKNRDIVCIVGSGTIGLATLLMVLKRRPRKVFVVDQNRKKLDIAGSFGADVIDFTETEPIEYIRGVTDGLGVDVVIEAVGLGASVSTAQKVTKTSGRMVWIGNSQKNVEVDMQDIVVNAKSITGCYAYNDENFAEALEYIESETDTASIFAEEEVPIEQAEKLFISLAKGEKQLLRGIVNIKQ